MKINYGLIFLILVIIALIVMGFTVILLQRTYGRSLDLGITVPAFSDIENYAGLDPVPGANNVFVPHPYRTGNQDMERSVIILASVSYILREIKYFIMFVILSATLAFSAWAIIVYFMKEDKNMTIKEKDTGGINTGISGTATAPQTVADSGKEGDGYIDKQTAGMVLLYIDINEMLSAVNSAIEKSETGRRVVLR